MLPPGRAELRGETTADRVDHYGEHDWDRVRLFQERGNHGSGTANDDFAWHSNKCIRGCLDARVLTPGPAIFDLQVATLDPSQFLKPLFQGRDFRLTSSIARSKTHQYADPTHPLALLRKRGDRPCRRPSAEK